MKAFSGNLGETVTTTTAKGILSLMLVIGEWLCLDQSAAYSDTASCEHV
jgi:hypothetical protein